jgi:hypothetical protein
MKCKNLNEMQNAKCKMRIWIHFILVAFLLTQYTIALSQEFEMPGYISDLTACDFDNNGAFDILVACPYADTLVILFNNGSGAFDIIYYDIISLHAICGCVDQDGIPDFIAGVGQQYFYKSNGDRTFENGLPILTLSGTVTVYGLVDLNNDEWNDLLYTNTSDEYWGIFKNNGNLTFTNEIIQSGSSTTNPAVGLITNDSLPDIVLTYSAFDRSSVNVNNGNFNFTEVILEETFIGEAFVMNIDNQGTDDFAFANYYTKTIPLYKFIGNNQFELQSNFYAEGTYPISSFLPADFNQDGYDDFAITRGDWWNSSDSLYIYFNDQNWSFYLHQIFYVGYLGFFNLKSADLNGDSFPDLYMSGAGTNGNKTLKLLWNDGTGLFSENNPVNILEQGFVNYSLTIFPNPFKTSVHIKIGNNITDRLTINISNIYGITLKSFSISENEIVNKHTIVWDGYDENLNSCSPGIYIVTARSNSNQISKKIIKY